MAGSEYYRYLDHAHQVIVKRAQEGEKGFTADPWGDGKGTYAHFRARDEIFSISKGIFRRIVNGIIVEDQGETIQITHGKWLPPSNPISSSERINPDDTIVEQSAREIDFELRDPVDNEVGISIPFDRQEMVGDLKKALEARGISIPEES